MTSSPTTAPLLPTSPAFAGHQTFAMRSGWLKKGLDALHENPKIFSDEKALVILGVGKNMVASIRYWLLMTQMAKITERQIQPTPLGLAIFAKNGFDPYLEDPATLWILHWNLCGPGSEAFTWVWSFNLWRAWEWSAKDLRGALLNSLSFVSASTKTPSAETIERDIGVFLQSYVAAQNGQNSDDGLDCPFRDLGLIGSGFEGTLRFAVGPKPTLPPAIFAWALDKFWRWKHAHSQTVSLREIAFGEGSPGVVFKLDEDSVLEYLDSLAFVTQNRLRFEDTLQSRQVVRSAEMFDGEEFLSAHYGALCA